MTTVSPDCSSGRGRRAPLLLSGLVVSGPVWFRAPSPFPPCLRVFSACARNNRYERRRLTRGARAPVLRPLEMTPGMPTPPIVPPYREIYTNLHNSIYD